MNKAKQPKKSIKRPSKKQIIVLIVSTLILIPLLAIVYQKYLDYADEKRFVQLKSDILALQEEFNKIDPGWGYSEGCSAGGAALYPDAYKSCFVRLSNNSTFTDKYSTEQLTQTYSNAAIESGYFDVAKRMQQYAAETEPNKRSIVELERAGAGDGVCYIDNSLADITLTCRYSARVFYFERIDE